MNFKETMNSFFKFHEDSIKNANYNEKTFNRYKEYEKYFSNIIINIKSEEITNHEIVSVNILSYIYIYFKQYYKYKKMIKEMYEFLKIKIKALELFLESFKEIKCEYLEENLKSVLGPIKENLAILYYDLGTQYYLDNDIDNMLDSLTKACELNHIPSINNLATFYLNPNLGCYNEEKSKELYLYGASLEVDTRYISSNLINNRKYVILMMCTKAASIMNDQKKYNEAIEYYDKCLRIAKEINLSEIDTKEIERLKEISLSYLNDKNIHTNRKQEIESMFSEKSKRHLTDEHYLFLESSLTIFDYLSNMENNESLDYSGAIISALKCLESILFQIFGVEYYDFIKTKKVIDYNNVPREFKIKEKNYYINKLCEKDNIIMELGSFIYACSKYDLEKEEYVINDYFLEFMNSRKIFNFDKNINKFIEKLKKVKDDYRNPAAHRNKLNKIVASECLDYLLNTIKYINECLEWFYND